MSLTPFEPMTGGEQWAALVRDALRRRLAASQRNDGKGIRAADADFIRCKAAYRKWQAWYAQPLSDREPCPPGKYTVPMLTGEFLRQLHVVAVEQARQRGWWAHWRAKRKAAHLERWIDDRRGHWPVP